MVDLAVEQVLHLCHVAGLPERPHGLCDDGLGGHVGAAQDARMVRIRAANLVNSQVKPLFRNLRRHDGDAPRIDP